MLRILNFLFVLNVCLGFAQKKGGKEKWYSYKGEKDSIHIYLDVCYFDSSAIQYKLRVRCVRKDSFGLNIEGKGNSNYRVAFKSKKDGKVHVMTRYGHSNDSTLISITTENKQ